jgi:hypothetical protein
MLNVITLNEILLKNHYKVQIARYRKAWTMHLSKKIKENSQSNTVKCSSYNKYEIECFCVNDNSSARFRLTTDVNLIMISTVLIIDWVKQTSIILRNDVLLNSWNIKQDYIHERLNHLTSCLRIENRLLLKCINDVFRDSIFYADVSTVVMITIKKCYNQHVVNLFIRAIILFKKKSRDKTSIKQEIMKFAWNKTCIDKIHQNQTTINEIILIFKFIESHVRRWFFTEIFFESSFD